MAAELGLGLIGIGRAWGDVDPVVSDERQARELLERALALGIRFYDTGPSYGERETRVGAFLRTLTAEQRRSIRVATKLDEHWDPDRQEPFVDHSRDALCRSLDQRSVGIREFRGQLSSFLESTTPVAITRHGETVGFYVPR